MSVDVQYNSLEPTVSEFAITPKAYLNRIYAFCINSVKSLPSPSCAKPNWWLQRESIRQDNVIYSVCMRRVRSPWNPQPWKWGCGTGYGENNPWMLDAELGCLVFLNPLRVALLRGPVHRVAALRSENDPNMPLGCFRECPFGWNVPLGSSWDHSAWAISTPPPPNLTLKFYHVHRRFHCGTLLSSIWVVHTVCITALWHCGATEVPCLTANPASLYCMLMINPNQLGGSPTKQLRRQTFKLMHAFKQSVLRMLGYGSLW